MIFGFGSEVGPICFDLSYRQLSLRRGDSVEVNILFSSDDSLRLLDEVGRRLGVSVSRDGAFVYAERDSVLLFRSQEVCNGLWTVELTPPAQEDQRMIDFHEYKRAKISTFLTLRKTPGVTPYLFSVTDESTFVYGSIHKQDLPKETSASRILEMFAMARWERSEMNLTESEFDEEYKKAVKIAAKSVSRKEWRACFADKNPWPRSWW